MHPTSPIFVLQFLLRFCLPVNAADETDWNARNKVDKLWVEQQVAEECIVSTFGAWSQCSAPCGGGYTKRTRSVLQQGAPRSTQGASVCPALSQRRECNTMPCAVACRVTSWGAYMRCRAPCGHSGITMRSRSVSIPPAFGGRKCPSLVQLKSCLGTCTSPPRSAANSRLSVAAEPQKTLNEGQGEDMDAARERKRLQLLAQLHALGPPRRNPRAVRSTLGSNILVDSSDIAVDTVVSHSDVTAVSGGAHPQSRRAAARAQDVIEERPNLVSAADILRQHDGSTPQKKVKHTSGQNGELVKNMGLMMISTSTSEREHGRIGSDGSRGGNNSGDSGRRGGVRDADVRSNGDTGIEHIDNGATTSGLQSSTVTRSAGALCQQSSPWASRAGQEPQCLEHHDVSQPTLGQDWTHRLSFEVVQPDGSTLLVHGGQLRTTSPNTSKMTQTGMFLTWNALIYVAFACIVVVLACVYVIARFFGVTFWFRRHVSKEATPPQNGSLGGKSDVRDGHVSNAAKDTPNGKQKLAHDVAVNNLVPSMPSTTKKIATSESMSGVEATTGIASKLNASLSTLFFRPETEGRTWVDDDGVEWQIPEHSDSDSDRCGHSDGGIFVHSSSDENGQSLHDHNALLEQKSDSTASASQHQQNGSQLYLSPSTAPQGTIVNQAILHDDLAWPPEMLPPPAVDTTRKTLLQSDTSRRSSRAPSAAASPRSPASPLYTRGQERTVPTETTVMLDQLSKSPRRVLTEAGRALEEESVRQQLDVHGSSATPSNSSACQSPRLNPAAKVFTPSRCTSPAVCSLPPSLAASPKINVMLASIDNISPLASPQQKPLSPSSINLPQALAAGSDGFVDTILQHNDCIRHNPPSLGDEEVSADNVETFGDPEVDADYKKFLAQIETDANEANTSHARDGTDTVATHTPLTHTMTTLRGDTATDIVSAAVPTRRVQLFQSQQSKQTTPRKVGNMEVRSQRYATDFDQIRSLGAGGFGKVYLCRSKLDAREYAVKIVKLGTGTQQRLQKMLREMKVLADLNHVHIVRYYQAWLEEDGEASDSESETSRPSKSDSNVETRSGHHNARKSALEMSQITESSRISIRDNASADATEDVALSSSWRSDRGNLQLPGDLTMTASSHSDSDGDDEHTKGEFEASMTRSWGGFQFQSMSKAFSVTERSNAAMTDAPSHPAQRPSLVVRNACSQASDTMHDAATLIPNDSRRINFVHNAADMGSLACVEASGPVEAPALNLDCKPQLKATDRHGLTLYILMEFCSQRTLREHLDNRSTNAAAVDVDGEWKPDLDEVFRCMIQIASALAYIHSQKLIHRDLKPSNIFKGEDNTLKLGDFGLARTTNSHISGSHASVVSSPRNIVRRRASDADNRASALLSKNTQGVGTALYMSPEQMQGREYDAKTDMYSLGVVLFELLHPPFATTMERYKTLSVLHDPQQCSQGGTRDASSTALGEGETLTRYPAGMIERVRKLPNGDGLVDLLNRLLAEHAMDRPTAAEALSSLRDMVHTPASVDSRVDSVMTDGNLDVALRVEAVPSLQPVAFMTLVNQAVETILPTSTITRMNFKEMGGKRIVELGLLLHLDDSVESASDAHVSHVADATRRISVGLQALPEVLSTEVHKK